MGRDHAAHTADARKPAIDKRYHAHLDDNGQNAYTQRNRRPRLPVALLQGGGVLIFGKLTFVLFALLILNSACSLRTATPSYTPPSLTQNASPMFTPHATLAGRPSTIPAPLATPSACQETSGSMHTAEVDDPSLVRALPYRVYLPPCFDYERETPYPTLYLLHGLTYTDSQWDELGMDETADKLITSGQIPHLIIVMPWERTGINLEVAVVDVLVPIIDQNYPTERSPRERAIGGISRGGGLALRIGLRHPEVFGAIGLHSPANLYSPPYIVRWINQIHEDSFPRLWIDIGESDSLKRSADDLLALLDEYGMPYTSQVSPGDHSPAYWSSQLETYLQWYASDW